MTKMITKTEKNQINEKHVLENRLMSDVQSRNRAASGDTAAVMLALAVEL